jgi:hypothetical protein
LAGDDEEMQRFVPIEDLFKGRHFDQQIIVLCVSWYTSFKPSSLDLGDDDGRPRHFRDAYNDSPVGPALPAGVREALAALRSNPSADRGGWTRPIFTWIRRDIQGRKAPASAVEAGLKHFRWFPTLT